MLSEAQARRCRDLTSGMFKYLNQVRVSGLIFERQDAFNNDREFNSKILKWSYGLFKRLKDEGSIEVVGKSNSEYRALRSFDITEDLISDYASTTLTGKPSRDRRAAGQSNLHFDNPEESEPSITVEMAISCFESFHPYVKSLVSNPDNDGLWFGMDENLKKLASLVASLSSEQQGIFYLELLPSRARDLSTVLRLYEDRILKSSPKTPYIREGGIKIGGRPPNPEPESEPKPGVEDMLSAFFQLLPALIPAIQRIESRLSAIEKILTVVCKELGVSLDVK